jgi:hypothetical protein
MYNPNMKVEILAIPPRASSDHVCCRWRLSMRDESDPRVRPFDRQWGGLSGGRTLSA